MLRSELAATEGDPTDEDETAMTDTSEGKRKFGGRPVVRREVRSAATRLAMEFYQVGRDTMVSGDEERKDEKG